MPKVPLAVVSTSSDDSDESDDDLACNFKDTNWTIVNMASIESFPFSEVSHQPYGMESTFLDSVSQGSTQIRKRNSTSAQQELGSMSQRITPQSPRPLLAHGPHARLHLPPSLNPSHPRGSNGGLPSPRNAKNGLVSPLTSPVNAAATIPAKTSARHAGELPMNLTAPSRAAVVSHRGRKPKPKAQRKRSLQVGAPRWRDSDGDMELLVRREVSKNGPISPAVTEDYLVVTPHSSSSSAVLTPPPLWVEATASKGQAAVGENQASAAPAAVVPTPTKAATTRSPNAASTTSKVDTYQKDLKTSDGVAGGAGHDGVVEERQPPPPQRRLSSPKSVGGVSKIGAAAQRQTIASAKPAQLQSSALHHPLTAAAAAASGGNSDISPLMTSSRANLPPGRRVAPLSSKQKPSATATVPAESPSAGPSSTFTVTNTAASPASASATFSTIAEAAGAATHSRSPLALRAKPRTSLDLPSSTAAATAAGTRGSGETTTNDSAALPSTGSTTANANNTITTTTSTDSASVRTASVTERSSGVSSERPLSARQTQRRRQQRRLSIQSTHTDSGATVASSVDTVEVRMNSRHPTLKPLITSPDAFESLAVPTAETGKGNDRVRGSLPALSPHQLSGAPSFAASPSNSTNNKNKTTTSLTTSTTAGTAKSAEKRGQGSSSRRGSQTVLPLNVNLAPVSPVKVEATAAGRGGGGGINKHGSMKTLSTVFADSPPKLRPETREFTEKPRSPSGSPSFVSPANRATAEKLVSFVRAVSDPEVLHVIHDYLIEQQRTTPRYRLAATACEELLERKEELLTTQEPNGDEGSGDGTHRGSAFDDEPFVVEVKPPEGVVVSGGESRADKLRRLLEEVAAESKAAEEGDGEGGDEDPAADEFDDVNFFDTPYPPPNHFSFGQPSVSGVVSRVFAEGMLFKIKTPKGEYFFFNDTLQDVMMVRVQCVLRGNETINERAMLAPVDGSAETEITIAVLPEETNFFMSGVSHLPHFMAKRVPVPPDYVSPSVTQSLRKINAEINSVRKALGKWSRASDQNAFLKCCLKNHLKFTDLNFRPCAESLFRPACDAVSIPSVTWRRPEEYVYLPEISQTRLFRGEISCFLVKQGELENHTVVAAMAAIAQFPNHVRWMFRHPVSAHVGKMERAEGCYRVTLLHNGWWKTYIIDDYVPASQKGPLFASCAEDPRRLWVPLLEKAYAKSLGSYAATCVVDAMEALGDFTGFPVRYLDTLWAAAKMKPTEQPSRALFSYMNRVVRAGCTVLLFTPAATDAQAKNTVDLSRKRSSRLLPVKGVVPQFLPGHIYFLHDVAFYEELDLRMARLKNPWTWETRHRAHREKKWKYTTWYDRPDISISAMGSFLGSSGGTSSVAVKAQAKPPSAMSAEEHQRNERKGTMWVEWGEVLAAFAGGGVCYTLWDHHRYRTRNAFVNGRPRFVLEMKARRRVDVFVTLSLETVAETLDNFDTVVASRPTPLYGTAMAAVQRVSAQSARVVSESCEDVECVAARRTYVVAKDVSMKLTIDPRVAEGVVFVVPLLDPKAVEDMAAAAAGATVGAAGGSTKSAALSPQQSEVHFVLSIVSDAVAGDEEDLSVSFVAMRRSCGVFTDSAATFDLESTSRVTSSYQICTERGVVTLEGNRICDAEAAEKV
uniref:Putative calpain protein n=1 Tax=Angomonas deanei TaxID=59799 RepID=C6K3U6_9TRYP|nr:putative calpain protein [Angomonas deanei]